MIIKNTQESNNAVYSVIDINRKASVAINRHPKFFNSDMHKFRVNEVESAGRNYLSSWEAIYITARLGTRSRKVHTEVKFSKIKFPMKRQEVARKQFVDTLYSIDVDFFQHVIYKPNTNSISILVF